MTRRELFSVAAASPLVSAIHGEVTMRMKVYANGFPKSGNHALVKGLQLLGVPCEVNHNSHADGVPEGHTHHIFIKRDPRNVLVSMLRRPTPETMGFSVDQITEGMMLAQFRQFQRKSLVAEMREFEPWLHDSGVKVIAYESLISDPTVLQGVADFLGIPYIGGAFEQLPGITRTWNEEHSDYRRYWGPVLAEAWSAEGGDDLLQRWGY